MIALIGTMTMADAGRPDTDAERAEALDARYQRFRFLFPKVEEIDAPALQAALDEPSPPVVVDVRPEAERAVSMLPGAVPLDDYEAHPERYAGRRVVTYCTVGVRSGLVANRLRKDGVDVVNFRGSILAWTLADGALVTPDGEPTRDVHVYRSGWNYAAEDYRAVVTRRNGTVKPL